MSDRMADVPPFTLGAVTWRCWVIDEDRYEWRSEGGRGAAGRNEGSATCWASLDGIVVEAAASTLREAMHAASAAARRRTAA